MTKKELIEQVAEDTGTSKHIVGAVLEKMGHVVAAELLGGGEAPLPGLGKLKAEQRAARTGRNPRTGEKIDIPARLAVVFSAGKELKEALK